ncbi:MAG TPA: right-handed parallel beta-helix repeat-containing protein [Candidatus Latescibacteria bacterium]|nr:MAG: flagellar basal body rod modification protein [Candidatus Latescibacteria bacterium ADurb.Bin168]HPU85468.1 right-handed parallel beta-helix repeat-containing protein [Candidatus Latescibacterota bacterium]
MKLICNIRMLLVAAPFLVWARVSVASGDNDLPSISIAQLRTDPKGVLQQYLGQYGWRLSVQDVGDVSRVGVIEDSDDQIHVWATQRYQGIPVENSMIRLQIRKSTGRVVSASSSWKTIPSSTSTVPSISAAGAVDAVWRHVPCRRAEADVELGGLVFRYYGEPPKLHLTWEVVFRPFPNADNNIGGRTYYVDANTGDILSFDPHRVYYVTGSGKVFYPDPRTSENNAFPGWDSTSTIPDSAYKVKPLAGLDASIGGVYRLRGQYARSYDIYGPYTTLATRSDSLFNFTRDSAGFGEVMAYFYIDSLQRYLRGLGITSTGVDSVRFDAHGAIADSGSFMEWDQTAYNNGTLAKIILSDRWIKDAEDADAIIHEYTHALHWGTFFSQTKSPNYTGEHARVTEGLASYMALSYSRSLYPNFERDSVYNWCSTFNRHVVSDAYVHPDSNLSSPNPHYPGGNLWATTLANIEDAIIAATGSQVTGRNRAMALIWKAVQYAPGMASTMLEYASLILEQASSRNDGEHFDEVLRELNARGLDTLTVNATFSLAATIPAGTRFVIGPDVTLTLNTDLVVASGAELIIEQGAELRFDGGTKLLVEGTLTANGAKFTRNGASGTWIGILTSTANASIALTNCTVEYANTGVFCDYGSSSSQPTVIVNGGRYHHNTTAIRLIRAKSTSGTSYIKAAEIDNNTTGIRMENCSVPIGISGSWTYRDSIHDNTGTAIYLVSSYPNIYRNKICNNGGILGGVYCSSTSSPDIVYNNISNNGNYGIYSDGSYPDIEHNWLYGANNSEIYITGGGQPWMEYTNIHTSVYGDNPNGEANEAVYFNSSGYLECENNWYGDASPVMSAIVNQAYRLVYNYPILSSAARSDYQKPARSVNETRPEVAVMRDAGAAEDEDRLTDALTLYRQVIVQFPESSAALRALHRSFAVMGTKGASQKEMESFFAPLQATDSPLGAGARFAAAELVRQSMAWHGDFARAIPAYRSVAADTSLLLYQRDAAWLQIARLADQRHDRELLREAICGILAFGDSTLEGTKIARIEWSDEIAALARQDTDKPPYGQALTATPNPFNPTTSITYRVTAQGNVSVQVYNALGQRVRELVNTAAPAGTYTVVWDGKDSATRPVGSGVYLIRLTTPTAVVTERVTLLR